MKRCGYCSRENPDSAIYCVHCGEPLDDFDTKETVDAVIDDTPKQKGPEDGSSVRCPSCGSSDIHFVTTETGSDFRSDSACCGFLLFGPIGLLCGLSGDRQSRTVRKCMNCGHEF